MDWSCFEEKPGIYHQNSSALDTRRKKKKRKTEDYLAENSRRRDEG